MNPKIKPSGTEQERKTPLQTQNNGQTQWNVRSMRVHLELFEKKNPRVKYDPNNLFSWSPLVISVKYFSIIFAVWGYFYAPIHCFSHFSTHQIDSFRWLCQIVRASLPVLRRNFQLLSSDSTQITRYHSLVPFLFLFRSHDDSSFSIFRAFFFLSWSEIKMCV